MVEKLKLERNPLNTVVEQVAAICPAAVQNGQIDFERLRMELSENLMEPDRESYNFTWVGKNAAIAEANKRIRKTLRPAVDESKNWDTTQNLYIEGDNLDVLKLLQEPYLGRVKMIYIDPPYNTGNDFVYCDDFAQGCAEYINAKGQCDVETNERLFRNTETNGRFHSDWCSMMYPRLKIARDLLSDDGVIFISIDDHEVANLRKICDEVFGEDNFESTVLWRRRTNQPNDATKMIAQVSEYVLVIAKNSSKLKENGAFNTVPLSEERLSAYSNPDNDPKGEWSSTPWCASKGQGGSTYEIITPTGKKYMETWLGTEETFKEHLKENRIYFPSNGDGKPRKKIYKTERILQGQSANNWWFGQEYGDNLSATSEMKKLFESERIFDYPKPINLIKRMGMIASDKNSIILDFFSGSATTAHAVMQLNAEDGGNRKFIMVQLPEKTDEKSEAFKAGYTNICEIGRERIRRAGDKIESENPDKHIDTGFRVLKLDDSNMCDVYFSPSETKQQNLLNLVDNVKADRGDMDLLFSAMLDRGLTLDMPIKTVKSGNTTYYIINHYDDEYIDLIACFDKNIPESVVYEMAKLNPLCAIFRDCAFANPQDKINLAEIFKNVNPAIKVWVL